ncbi:MAG: alpha/beta hydrolase, partial [Bacteroidetes bacterium]
MLFITNCPLNEGNRFVEERSISFSIINNLPEHNVYFCERISEGNYREFGGQRFMSELKHSHYSQVLIYIHGQTSQPERDVFPMVEKLQQLFDRQEEDLVQVVPMIWPCYDPEVSETHFWSDQKSADSSEFAYGRVLESFMAWRESAKQDETPCLKRINILAHSMGARVIRGALLNWAKYDRGGSIPMIFRNIFLTAPDLGN